MANVDNGRLFELVEKMPAFSTTVAKVISLANNPQSSPSDLVNTITMDPVLTAKLLKLINSAYFGLRQPIVSLNRAVIMLGFNTVKNVTLSISVAGTIKVKENFKWFSRDQYWEHSLACAVASKAIALKAGISVLDLEEYFIGGLLHDIGKTLMIHAFTSDCEEIYDPVYEPDRLREELEKERFGMTHADLGGIIAKQWKFPESLVDGIAKHHNPMEGVEENHLLRTIIYIANYFCNEKNISTHPLINPVNIPEEVWNSFKLDKEQTAQSLDEMEDTLEKAKIFLQVVGD